jgi:hypothetical protein
VTGQPVGAPAAFLDVEFKDRDALSGSLLETVADLDPKNNPFNSQVDDARTKLAISGRRLMKGEEYDRLMRERREQAK